MLPVYSNPILFGWRLDSLKELGFDEVPKNLFRFIESRRQNQRNGQSTLGEKDLADPTA